MASSTGSTDIRSYCRICEALCGVIATVDDGRLVDIKPNRDHALSEGFLCVKGRAMVDVVNDPDRILSPLRRAGGPGTFEPVSWDEALADIAGRLRALTDAHGPEALAVFVGNPPAFDCSAYLAVDGFQKAVGTPWKYGVNGEDAASRNLASALLYGSPALILVPDLWHTDFCVVIGANPLVSKGSMVSEPRFRDALDGIVSRGGRVLVIDPRRTETAQRYDHRPLHAGTDAFLLGAIIHTILDEHLFDVGFAEQWTDNLPELRRALSWCTPETASQHCGVESDSIRALARDLASSPSAVVYGRTGTCTQQFGTLTNFLQDVVNILTGNLDRRGGWLFSWGPVDFARFADLAGMSTYGKIRTRARGLPDVLGLLPSQGLAEDIELAGPGRIRALCIVGANPVRSSGAGGTRLERAMAQLELTFSLDLYQNETNKHADYILPVLSMYEREDLPFTFLGNMLRPTAFATEAVIAPMGQARSEWAILDDLARRLGRGGAYSHRALRALARIGIRPSPRALIDVMLRMSPAGDRFGLQRGGISFRKLQRHPDGVRLRDQLPTGVLGAKLRTASGRIDLAPDLMLQELRRLLTGPQEHHLRLVGMREVRSHNSWMHNSARLTPPGRVLQLRIHPDDAQARGVVDGAQVRVSSPGGSIEVAALVSDEMFPGNVALPHGWGHSGGWTRANALPGASSNDLAGPYDGDIEPLTGMSVLNGIPVDIEPVGGPSASLSSGQPVVGDIR